MKLTLLSCVAILILSGCAKNNTSEEVITIIEVEENEVALEETGVVVEKIQEVQDEDVEIGTSQLATGVVVSDYTHLGILIDVTEGTAEGQAEFGRDGQQFLLDVTMENLPPLQEGYFYEGRLVRKTPFEFISTGPIDDEGEDQYSNVRTTTSDYSDYLQYVLTLEPDDGDPAPAEHVLEGDLEPIE